MLAYSLCSNVGYDPLTTVLSMLPAFVAAWIALSLLSRPQVRLWQLLTGGVLVGAGIGVMHYSGMAAIHDSIMLRFDPAMFALSIVVAVLLSILALWLRFGLNARNLLPPGWRTLVAGTVLGLAISSMHYTGMAAARFVVGTDIYAPQSNTVLAITIALITLLAILVAGVVNAVMHYRAIYHRIGQSEARLRTIVDTAVDGIISIGSDGIVRAFNPSAEKIFGWRADEVIGRNINMLMPEPDRSRHDGYLSAYLRTGKASIIGVGRDVTGLHRNGDTFPMRLAIGKAELPDETLFIGFVTDTSQRNAMERALRDSERQHRSLVSNLPGVAFRCRIDEDWSMLFISDAVERMTGWSPAEFIGGQVTFASIIHPDDRVRTAASVLAAVEEGTSYFIEYRLIRRNGEERWVSETGNGVRDDSAELSWIDGLIIDNTEVKLRNAAYEGVVNAIHRSLAVIEFDLDGRILDTNDSFLTLTGYTRDELCGRNHDVLCSPEDIVSDDYKTLWRKLRQGQFVTGEFRRMNKAGQGIWIQGSYNPIFDPDGQPYKIIKFATDLSERHLMEQDLREAKARAEQAAAAKGSFLANMSHEIRTPMNAIIGFTDVLLAEPLEDGQRRHLNTIRNASRSLLSLLNDILDTAKLERGVFELERADFSLREVCHHVLASLRVDANKKGLDLKLDYPDVLPEFFKGDSLRLQQVLLNLLGNAIKFTEQGSVALQVNMDDDIVHLTISDTGIGIAPDRIERIFDPFSQADASMTRRFGGTGLGTTIARQLVELMDGTIHADSILGKGSHFHVRIPLPPGSAVAAASEQQVQLPPLRILVVDDVPQNIELLELMLSRAGHAVMTAVDGIDALLKFESGRYDVILMDVQMPRLDGLEACRRIRILEAARGLPHTPVVALTASVLEADQVAARNAGMDGFATKPIEILKLNLEIARLLKLQVEVINATPLSTKALIRGSVIDWSQGLRLWGSEQRHKQAIASFLTEHGNTVDYLRSLDEVDFDALKSAAHRLRGAAGNLALSRVAGIAARIEKCEQCSAASVKELLSALGDELASVCEALGVVHMSEQVANHEFDHQQAMAQVTVVAAGLTRGELSEGAIAWLVQHLPAPRLRQLLDALDAFDFDAARQALAGIQAWLSQRAAEEKQGSLL